MIAIPIEAPSMFAVMAASVTTFAATNIGDLVLLDVIFQTRKRATSRPRTIARIRRHPSS
jgi:cadmium resistance protein CadD (predicted permease)